MIEIGFIFGLAIYGIIWFLALFVVLPFGVVSQSEAGSVISGSPESAPVRPHIGKKLLITTFVAGIIYGVVYWLLTSGALTDLEIPFLPDFGLKEK